MAQKNRSKELWLVPKRSSIHQTICLIEGIVDRNYNGKSWDAQKQNNLGVNLKNRGATNTGKNISNQSIRTLAALPQYLGLLYINSTSTPNTINLTKAGYRLLNAHKNDLVTIPNLKIGGDSVITESPVVLEQMEKLLITNPIILKDCENILLFPFRITLYLLSKLTYLDREEIGYYLLRMKEDSEKDLVIQEIENFRSLEIEKRSKLMFEYKKTHLGNITLVQASSASYFEALLEATGVIERTTIKAANSEKKLQAIKVKTQFQTYVDSVLDEKYQDAEIYDFGSNVDLWIEYIGDPSRLFPPIIITLTNNLKSSFLINIEKENHIIHIDLIEEYDSKVIPMFPNEEYILSIISIENGTTLESIKFIPTFSNRTINISNLSSEQIIENRSMTYIESFNLMKQKIISHSEASNFSGEFLNYLNVLLKSFGINKTTDKSLRGGYYEYLFFSLLNLMKKEGLIDEVIWNGKIGKFGLPIAAPGGKLGTPDLVFTINNIHYVLELTTIKAKSLQQKAEVPSVVDHIRVYKDNLVEDYDVVGIFSAPLIHDRNNTIMNYVLNENNIDFMGITDNDLLEIFASKSKDELIQKLPHTVLEE